MWCGAAAKSGATLRFEAAGVNEYEGKVLSELGHPETVNCFCGGRSSVRAARDGVGLGGLGLSVIDLQLGGRQPKRSSVGATRSRRPACFSNLSARASEETRKRLTPFGVESQQESRGQLFHIGRHRAQAPPEHPRKPPSSFPS